MAGGAGLTREAISLTIRTIEALRPAQVPYRVPDQRCIGLAIRVAPSGVKTWALAFRIRGTATVRRLSLGRSTDVSLERARDRANEKRAPHAVDATSSLRKLRLGPRQHRE